jgi:hypothetical protein
VEFELTLVDTLIQTSVLPVALPSRIVDFIFMDILGTLTNTGFRFKITTKRESSCKFVIVSRGF